MSRLNNDVIGAQQAFTSTLSGVLGNLISLVVVRHHDVRAVLAGDTGLAGSGALVHPSREMDGPAIGRTDPAADADELRHEHPDDRTFQHRGALLASSSDVPQEDAEFSRARRSGARHRRFHRDGQPLLLHRLALVAALATALVYGLGGNLVITGALTLGTLLALTGLLAQLCGPLTALSNVRVDVMFCSGRF